MHKNVLSQRNFWSIFYRTDWQNTILTQKSPKQCRSIRNTRRTPLCLQNQDRVVSLCFLLLSGCVHIVGHISWTTRTNGGHCTVDNPDVFPTTTLFGENSSANQICYSIQQLILFTLFFFFFFYLTAVKPSTMWQRYSFFYFFIIPTTIL
jgi:hypothetical protein